MARSNARAAKQARPSAGKAHKDMCRAIKGSYAYGHDWRCPAPARPRRNSLEDIRAGWQK